MSAEIAGCGHAKCFMEIDYLSDFPQIHLHFLTDDDFYDEFGYYKTEFCCHGCNSSVIMYYTNTNARKKEHILAKNEFKKYHKKCTNRKFESECPAFRANIAILDVRPKGKETKKRALTKKK